MQNTEASCEESERTIKRLKTSRSLLPPFSCQDNSEAETSIPPFSIFTKLLELHQEKCAKNIDEPKSGLKTNSHLLEKLVTRERLNTLILNLYPGNKGYSLAFRIASRTDQNSDDTANMIETITWPYEEDEILRYIDKEELPPHLLGDLESQYSYLFYNGCIIAEVRDYRQAYPHFKCDIHHVLLRPTLQSVLADVNNLVQDKEDWGLEERQMVESQILLANRPHMCLDPDNSISASQIRLNRNRHMWNTHKFRQLARKFSQVAVNRKRKLDQFTHRPGLELYDYMTRARSRPKSGQAMPPKREEIRPIPVPNLDPPPIGPPAQGVSIKEFKAYQHPKETNDYLPQLVEEYVLETVMPSKDKTKPRVYHIKLSILQRPSNSEFLGELYLDRDHKENERNGVACRFTLGSRVHANKYVQQFTEIFTESGRKSVRMRYGQSLGYKTAMGSQAQVPSQSATVTQATLPPPQQHNQLNPSLSSQSTVAATVVNGAVSAGVSTVQNQTYTSTSNVPILQSHLQGTSPVVKPTTQPLTNQEIEINALAIKLMSYGQQFQAAANAKQQQQQQQQQQKLASSGNNTIINLLNSSPASNVNSDASAAVVNAINNTSLLPQQQQQQTMHNINEKLLTRKMTLSNLTGNATARVLNHANLIVNNNRFADLTSQLNQQQQTITLTSANSAGNYTNYTTVPIKQHQQRNNATQSDANKSSLSALLVGTPAADRPDIVGPNTNSLLLEKLAGSSPSVSANTTTTHFIQSPKTGQQYLVQSPSPKQTTVMSPLSSPTQPTNTTINVQSLNFAQLQSLPGMQNVQVQLPGFAQPISLSLNVSSTGNIQGHPTSLIVSMPVTTASVSSSTITQAANNQVAGSTLGMGTPTVVLANAGTSSLAQLVSGMKTLNQQGIRTSGPATVSLTQGGQPFQLITPLQRPRLQQTNLQQNLTARTIQRTPITIKMAAPNTNASATATLSQLQKQAQLQQYQQLCLNQQQNVVVPGGKVRRRSNASEPQ